MMPDPLSPDEQKALQDAVMRTAGEWWMPQTGSKRRLHGQDFEAGWLAARDFYAIRPDPNPSMPEMEISDGLGP